MTVTGSRESENLCSHSVKNLHEATQMFMMVDYVREMAVNKPIGAYGLFDLVLFLLCLRQLNRAHFVYVFCGFHYQNNS